eukprot:3077066-Rhodomonas_salina.1
MLIASRNMLTAGTPLTLTLVEAAIVLAQLHLAELPPEDLTTKSDKDEDIDKDHALLTVEPVPGPAADVQR